MSYIDWVRSYVGNRKIFLVFATVIVRDENGRFLLQRRTDFDFWGLPGGVLEIDETIEACARRELLEETGLTVGVLTLTGIYTHPRYDVVYPNGDQVQQFTACFMGQMNGGVMRADGIETSHQQFFATDLLPLLTLPCWYSDMLMDAQQSKPPTFTPPFTAEKTIDQIAAIRPFINHERLIGVGATAVVLREDGHILTVRRQDNGQWFLPAGFSDIGENVAHTAVRETFEQTGLQIELQRILGIYSSPQFHFTYPNNDQVKNVGVVFLARWMAGEAVPDAAEVSEIKWITPGELLQNIDAQFYFLAAQIVIHLQEGVFVL